MHKFSFHQPELNICRPLTLENRNTAVASADPINSSKRVNKSGKIPVGIETIRISNSCCKVLLLQKLEKTVPRVYAKAGVKAKLLL